MIFVILNLCFAAFLISINVILFLSVISFILSIIGFVIFVISKFIYNQLGYVSHPDILLNDEQLIRSRGFDYESHQVTTDDGYILVIERVINPLIKKNGLRPKPVLLMHGMGATSAVWCLTGNCDWNWI